MNDVVEFLDRQYRYLDVLRGEAFLHQLVHWLRLLRADPTVSQMLRDLWLEAEQRARDLGVVDDALVAKLVEVRRDLVVQHPELDEPREVEGPDGHPYATDLYLFDDTAKDGRYELAIHSQGIGDGTRSQTLMKILDKKMKGLPETNKVRLRLGWIRAEHDFEFRRFLNDKVTSGGVALVHLQYVVDGLIQRPHWLEREYPFGPIRPEFGNLRGVADVMFEHAKEKSGSSPNALAKELAPVARRLNEELRHRVGRRRSLLALIHRFKERCEWHDRERLRNVVKTARAQGRKPEDALSAELALWLFDQGFSPLTEPSVGGLRPDLLDPSRLYVEAKRYNGSDGRSVIRKGARQVYSTVQRLRATKYEVDEALYVVFRESGPLYLLPKSVACGEWVMMSVVIDIAPMSETGRREKDQPIVVTEEELGPRIEGPKRKNEVKASSAR